MALQFLKRRITESSPYIAQNLDKKCVFVHVPKCAGISIEESIFDGHKVGHHPVRQYKQYSPYRFWKYFVFTFVRNPISRFESAFSFLKNGGRNPADLRWAEDNLKNIDTADEMVKYMRKSPVLKRKVKKWQHFRPQTWYLTDNSGGLPLDYIGRVETIQDDFEEICRRIGIDRRLPHKNKSSKSEADLLSNDRNIAFLREKVYERDIKMLGYESANETT
nr:sulfotransferase family 2 domain-containing protein [Salinibacter ruber]